MKMKKRILATILCICTLFGMVGAYSASADNLTPADDFLELGNTLDWKNIATISLAMSYNNGTITSEGRVTGQSGTTKITASFVLAKQGANGVFSVVDSWSASSDSIMLSSSRTTSGMTAGTYKLTVTTTVTRNGTNETVTESLTKTLS